jgi:hypothetical protein
MICVMGLKAEIKGSERSNSELRAGRSHEEDREVKTRCLDSSILTQIV